MSEIDQESSLEFERFNHFIRARFWEKTPDGRVNMEYVSKRLANDLKTPENSPFILQTISDSIQEINLDNPLLNEAISFIITALKANPENKIIFFSTGDPSIQKEKMNLILSLVKNKSHLQTDQISFSFNDKDKLQDLPIILSKLPPQIQVLVIDDNQNIIDHAQNYHLQTWWKNNQSPLGSLSRIQLDPTISYTILLDLDNTSFPEDEEHIPKIIANLYNRYL